MKVECNGCGKRHNEEDLIRIQVAKEEAMDACPKCKTDEYLADLPKYRVTNIDGVVKEFDSDQDFLDYAQKVYKENEEGQPYPSEIHWSPENLQQATEYIEEYCSDLTLEEL
jgi:NAD-dependent SIR2 family protein deacetylase